jgi:predicted Rossmann fold flavoprotein
VRYDLIVVGAGASGIMAAIVVAREGKRVLLLEKLPYIGAKLKATGGGRCNLTNRLDIDSFMQSFGRQGRFISHALELFDSYKLIKFFEEIGVESHSPDGFRVFPTTHSSSTIIKALKREMSRYDIDIKGSQEVISLHTIDEKIDGVKTLTQRYYSSSVVIATGGNGYPSLGTSGDGYRLAKSIGHTITPIYPAMMPLKTRELWVANCRADTIPKVKIKVDIPKYKKLQATGDLIFTKDGIRGPVVLDFSREITPIYDRLGEVPILINLTKGMNEEQIHQYIKKEVDRDPHRDVVTLLQTLLPKSLSVELCKIADMDLLLSFGKQKGIAKDKLISLLAWTPLTVVGHDGFEKAMITRGGVSLKEIDPRTMMSKISDGLYFCGEVVDLDGPCGGYNLQWSFASGYLAGRSILG